MARQVGGSNACETVIESSTAWRCFDVAELLKYRDLVRFLTWRSVKVRYAQSAVGLGWAVLQPGFQIFVFTVVFGRFVRIETPGSSHFAFYLATMVVWTYFASAVTSAADSLVVNANMLGKVYFPRIVLPLSAVLAPLFDFLIALTMSCLALLALGVGPSVRIALIPLLTLIACLAALGIGLWAAALSIQFRDVKHAIPFFVQLLLFASPVVYPAANVTGEIVCVGVSVPLEWVYALNPMVGVLEGFRAALLGTPSMPWCAILVGGGMSVVCFATGSLYFRSRERVFADVL